jgi:hypothetical protein
MVTLACWAADTSGTGAAFIRNAIVHELGHNLGLRHGGDEACNNKPNYNSVMNYLFEFNGVYTDCQPFATHNFALGYSSGGLLTLDENDLHENLGVCTSPIVPIDWNSNGRIFSGSEVSDVNSYAREVAECGATNSVLHDFNDWANLNLAAVSPSGIHGLIQNVPATTCAPIPAN